MPSTQNYSILKADVFLAKYGTDDFQHVGNAPSLTYSPSVETLEHFSSMAGVREKDAEVATTVAATVAMTLDEMTVRNIAIAMLGSEEVFTQAAATGEVSIFEGVEVGGQYLLKGGSVSNVAITDGATTPVSYVAGTHYTVDADAGVVTVTAIPSGADTNLEVTYDVASVAAGTRKAVNLLQDTNQEYSLVSIGRNDVGKRYRIEVGRIKITPTGSLGLISDEFAQLEIEGTALRDSTKPTHPFGRAIEL